MPRPPETAPPPLVAHVVDYFEAGGLENGLANLLNAMPPVSYRHAVICVRGYTAFRERVRRDDVTFIGLGKQPGIHPRWYSRLWRALRRMRPAIVHTRNLGALEAQAVAAAAGVTARVHGEHGRDVWDLDGTNRRYNLLRRALAPCVHRFIAVNADLERWLTRTVNVPPRKVSRIYNGVDTTRFHPRDGARTMIEEVAPYDDRGFVIGTVGRMAAVKNQVLLVKAFLHLIRTDPGLQRRLRLALVGDGPLQAECMALLAESGASHLVWMPGRRDDIPAILQSLDLFVLPSIAEGTSNTILEAMATGLPVVATAVGGNSELVVQDVTGSLVPSGDHVAMASAIRTYVEQPGLPRRQGAAGRRRVEAHFSLASMVDAYLDVYGRLLGKGGAPAVN